ncbi:MAG: hypothetical protein JWO38_3712 [Gemmataceae bacterium]|nr:hypothetical protein [Gemmataceae bacterium]
MPYPRRSFVAWVWPPPAIARRLWLAVAVAAAYTGAVYAACAVLQPDKPVWIDELGVANAVVVGVLVGFRTKAAYDRWWEGRVLWGELTNHSRNLCLKAVALAAPDEADRRALAALIAGFPVALMKHLRGAVSLPEVPGFETAPDRPAHVPAYLAGRAIALVAGWRTAGRLDGHGHQILDAHTSVLMNVCGACERIRTTPLPGSYLSLLRHGLILALVLAPWQLAITLGAWAIPAQAVLVYFLFGVELTAEEVEQPFGFDGDDLPLERYCETIRAGAEEILGVARAGK